MNFLTLFIAFASYCIGYMVRDVLQDEKDAEARKWASIKAQREQEYQDSLEPEDDPEYFYAALAAQKALIDRRTQASASIPAEHKHVEFLVSNVTPHQKTDASATSEPPADELALKRALEQMFGAKDDT